VPLDVREQWAEAQLFESFDDFLGGYHAGLAREDLLGKDAMHFVVSIGTAVVYDDHFVVHIGGPAHRREDDSARRNAAQDKRGNTLCAQNRLKVSCAKGTHTAFGDDNLTGTRFDLRVNLCTRATGEHPP
jgi:hypothetical protein